MLNDLDWVSLGSCTGTCRWLWLWPSYFLLRYSYSGVAVLSLRTIGRCEKGAWQVVSAQISVVCLKDCTRSLAF